MVYVSISRDDLRQHLMNVKKQVAQQQAQESESSSSSSSDDSSSSSSDSSNSSSDSSSGSKSCIVHITSQIISSWNKLWFTKYCISRNFSEDLTVALLARLFSLLKLCIANNISR